MTTETEAHWRQQSACADHNPMQFISDSPADKARARLICRGCPVLEKCRDWAMVNPVVGVWAGMDEAEREAYRPRWFKAVEAEGLAALSRMTQV
ncbi:WhiB family transcriptional regulator [Mycolicibacterium sphagni]|uniref:4Fe-4S Wbl-type domain-containing protein n=1 Tax=Mycolicibacterium sphagni TaxID=1786 RepID=A0A255DLL1_9MYCO|nr:WhiB family transcriptional regulator [Mycolicibacterium sphagni]OYN79980.1 hypothetical protein CG716_11015 [Mycolicibacterium sphagni]